MKKILSIMALSFVLVSCGDSTQNQSTGGVNLPADTTLKVPGVDTPKFDLDTTTGNPIGLPEKPIK